MNRTLLAGLAILGLGGVAIAADLPVKAPRLAPVVAAPAFSWNGCYVGANVGWARAEHDLSSLVTAPPAIIVQAARTALNNAGFGSIDGSGFTGGGQIGCNWQPSASAWVFGIEGDFNFLSADASRNTGNYVEPVSGRTVRSIDDIGMDWFATVRGRIGYAFREVLVYATGGVAFANIDVAKRFAWDFLDGCAVVNGLQECHVGGASGTRAGWTLGGGLEWAFRPNWSAKLEYLYADFGSDSFTTVNNGAAFIGLTQSAVHSVDTTLQVVRVGINYRFR